MPQPFLRTKIYPIFAPSKGLSYNVPAPFLDPRASPDCKNVRFYDQIVEKRTGYPSTDYATGTITGIPLKLYTYVTISGVEYEILSTTTNIYYNNAGAWTSIAATLSAEFLDADNWTSTGWTGTWATGWTHTAGNTTALSHNHAAVNATDYHIIYIVSGWTAGTFTVALGGKSSAGLYKSGVFDLTTSSTAVLTITPTSTFDGKIVITISTGLDIDNRISLNTMFINSKFYLVIGSRNYAGQKWDGTTYNAITSTAVYKPKILLPYQFRLLMFNIDEDGTDFPIKFRYSIANPTDATTDWTATGSGSRNMIQGKGSQIMNALEIKDYVGVYKDKSISILDYVGGSSIFSTAVHIDGVGLLAQDAIINLGTSHLFLGSDYNIYEWNGGWELIPIGDPVKKYIKDNIYKTNKLRCFAIPNFERTEAHFFIPIGTDTYPTRFLTYNWTEKSWSLNTVASCSGGGNIYNTGVEKSIIALSAGTVHNYDYSSLNDGSTAISSYFTTPDVTINKEEYKIEQKNYSNVYVDAKGNNLSMYYSVNEGSTWSTVDTDALDSTTVYNLHAFNYSKTARNIRYKFENNTASESYSVRFVGIEHKDRERK
jgi:hypothetical protein